MSDGIDTVLGRRVSRRDLLKRAAVGASGVMAAGLLGGCRGGADSATSTSGPAAAAQITSAGQSRGTVKIGFVSPRTGAAASFGEPDPYVIGLAKDAFASGFEVGGKTYSVEIIDKDGQSNPQRGAEVAQELISKENVDLILATSTPETTNPVSDTAEAAGVPCISTTCPWEAWYFGRGAKPGEPSPFRYTFHFYLGVEQFIKAYTSSWPQITTNKKIAVMWPNDADGNAIRAALGPGLVKAGYTIVDPGAYQNGSNDFSGQISQFKKEGCEIFNTFPLPPDFATFWRQAAQQGFKPKIAQIQKTGLFPSQLEALGELGYNLASAGWFTPSLPYKSSLIGISAKELCDGYEKASGKQWTQQVGSTMALFDVAAAVLKAVGDPKNKEAVAKAMFTLQVDTPLGPLKWGTGPVPNVVPNSLFNGQWVKGTGKYQFDWVLVDNSQDPNVPVAGQLQPYM